MPHPLVSLLKGPTGQFVGKNVLAPVAGGVAGGYAEQAATGEPWRFNTSGAGLGWFGAHARHAAAAVPGSLRAKLPTPVRWFAAPNIPGLHRAVDAVPGARPFDRLRQAAGNAWQWGGMAAGPVGAGYAAYRSHENAKAVPLLVASESLIADTNAEGANLPEVRRRWFESPATAALADRLGVKIHSEAYGDDGMWLSQSPEAGSVVRRVFAARGRNAEDPISQKINKWIDAGASDLSAAEYASTRDLQKSEPLEAIGYRAADFLRSNSPFGLLSRGTLDGWTRSRQGKTTGETMQSLVKRDLPEMTKQLRHLDQSPYWPALKETLPAKLLADAAAPAATEAARAGVAGVAESLLRKLPDSKWSLGGLGGLAGLGAGLGGYGLYRMFAGDDEENDDPYRKKKPRSWWPALAAAGTGLGLGAYGGHTLAKALQGPGGGELTKKLLGYLDPIAKPTMSWLGNRWVDQQLTNGPAETPTSDSPVAAGPVAPTTPPEPLSPAAQAARDYLAEQAGQAAPQIVQDRLAQLYSRPVSETVSKYPGIGKWLSHLVSQAN